MQKQTLKYMSLILAGNMLALPAYAVGPGFYLGAMAGPATNSASDQQAQVLNSDPATFVTASPKSKQFGSRFYLGYQMNRYAAVEGGFAFFSSIKYDTGGVQTCTGTSTRVRDIDVVGKGIIPIGEYFDVFGKAGVAVTYLTSSGAFNPDPSRSCGQNTYSNKFTPTFSAGASYNLDQSWVLDLTYTTILVGGAAGNVSTAQLGISYHFTDRYCGQFLCA